MEQKSLQESEVKLPAIQKSKLGISDTPSKPMVDKGFKLVSGNKLYLDRFQSRGSGLGLQSNEGFQDLSGQQNPYLNTPQRIVSGMNQRSIEVGKLKK